MKRSASPSLRASKRARRAPIRTPQTMAQRLALLTPEELAAAETARLVTKLKVLQAKSAKESQTRGPKRDTHFYMSDPFSYETRDPDGLVTLVQVAQDDMFIFLVENVLFRLPRPPLVAHSELFANMFTFPPQPDVGPEGRSNDRPIVLHGMRAEGMRQFVNWWIAGEQGHVYPFSRLAHLLQFAHQAGAHDIYFWAASALDCYNITRHQPWHYNLWDERVCLSPSDPSRSLCANNRLPITGEYINTTAFFALTSFDSPDDTFPMVYTAATLLWGDGMDLDSFDWKRRISRAEALCVLDMAISAGIDVAFLPGALGSVVISGKLSVDEAAWLMRNEQGDATDVAEAVKYGVEAILADDSSKMLGPGALLVGRLKRALDFWAYCRRHDGEAIHGMMDAIIRVMWPAPNETSEGWEMMCVQP
ncbi:unnamed protein product [Peniophora sp. CBMAI 1063]|nr:unnamed protein product [Peniophora sp. CBMAI 1063]